MTSASFPKFVFLLVMFSVLTLALAGCGSSDNLALTQGNWAITATPTGSAAIAISTFYVGGNLTQNGNNLAGTMYVINSRSECYDSSQPIPFTGTVNGKKVVLTSASTSSQVITVTATGTSASALSGTYVVSGGCDDGDTGTLTAGPVPSITGIWSGPLLSSGGDSVTLALALTQAGTASSDGTFALTGSGTFKNSSCSSTATISRAFIAGPNLVIQGATDDGGSLEYLALLNSASAPTNMNGSYSLVGGDGGCDGDLDSPTLTKQ